MQNTTTEKRKITTQQMALVAIMTALTYLLLIVFTGLEAWNVKLRHLPSDWIGWCTGIFRIYRRTGETFWSNRWIFNRIYSNGNHCRYCN